VLLFHEGQSFALDEVVAEAVLASERGARAAINRIGASGAWPEVIARAQTWGIIPLLHSRSSDLDPALPQSEALLLRRISTEASEKNGFRVDRGIEALRALHREGIRAAAIADAGLMIAETDLPASLSCLAAAGFKGRGDGEREAGRGGASDGEIDLHWDLGSSGMSVADLLNRAVPASFGGVPIRVVHPVDAFLLSAHHIVRNNLAAESSVRNLSDLQKLCAPICESGWPGELAQRAQQASLTVAALAVANVLEGYDPADAVCRVASRLRKSATPGQQRAAVRLTRAFHYQLENGSLNRDLLDLVHPRPFRRIAAGLRRDSLGRRAMELVKSCGKPRALRVARDLARAKFES
jgi:hypothetical protein